MPSLRAHHPRDVDQATASNQQQDILELVSDFTTPTGVQQCRSFEFELFDGRQGFLSAVACSRAPGSRPVVLIDDVISNALQPWQSTSPIGEATAHLALAVPWLVLQRTLFLVHETRGPLADKHHFYEISPSVAHHRIQGYGTTPLGNPDMGYDALVRVLGPERDLIDQRYPQLLPS